MYLQTNRTQCYLHSSIQNRIHNVLQICILIDLLIVLQIPLHKELHNAKRIHVLIDILIVLHIVVHLVVQSTIRIHILIDIQIMCYGLLHILPNEKTYYRTDYNTDSTTNWTYSMATYYLFNTDCLTLFLNFTDFHTD